MKIARKTKIVAPVMIAAFLMAPMQLIQSAQAQNRPNNPNGPQRPGGGGGDDRNDNRRDNNGRNTADRRGDGRRTQGNYYDVTRWFDSRNFVGTASFKLIDDPTLRQHEFNVQQTADAVKNLDEQADKLEKVLDAAQKVRDALSENIKKLTAEIGASTIEKAQLKQKIPGLERELGPLETQVSLAEASMLQTQGSVDQAQAQLDSAKTACEAAPSAECQQQVNQLTAALNQKKSLNEAAKKDVAAKKKTRDDKKAEIAGVKVKIEKIDEDNNARALKVAESTAKLPAAMADVQKAQEQLAPVLKRYEAADRLLDQHVANRDHYLAVLVKEVNNINAMGARIGAEAGGKDGAVLAQNLGTNEGHRDGSSDGHINGTAAGQSRVQSEGRALGASQGQDRAQREGERDGSAAGSRQGNIDAGEREGSAAGSLRAQNSDAASVGVQTGRTAGHERAVNTGNTNGTRTGEAQAVNQFESRNLPTTIVNGSFVGAFARRTPGFPNNYTGQSFNVNVMERKEILKRAYADGYAYSYHTGIRYEFQRIIDGIYNAQFDASYTAAYRNAEAMDYPQIREEARRTEEARTFNQVYPGIRDASFNSTRAQVAQNPDRQNQDFRGTYSRVESATYNSQYEAIRSANFSREEAATFADNIAEQTEIFRKKRFDSVTKVYSENAVLKYVSSDIADGGINGIAKADGVFQPGETTIHSVTVKNFGLKSATNASITLDNGERVKLPEIPAGSEVTVKGAALGKVAESARIGGSVRMSARLDSALSAEAAVQGRHYDNASGGVLKASDSKDLRIAYPLALSGLASGNQLLINSPEKLRITVSNQSQRAYQGPLKIDLRVNSSGNVITKGFSDLSSLSSSTTLSDASVLVTDERDVYSPITFTASIHQGGVKIGELTQSFTTMVKAPYVDKKGAKVVIVNSDANPRDLLDVLSDIGGIAGNSVLDLSLAGLNSDVLKKGLDKKVAIVVDNGRGSAAGQLESLLNKSKNSVMLFVDDNMTGLNIAKGLNAFKGATNFPARVVGQGLISLTQTNPYLQKDNAAVTLAMQANRRNFTDLLSIAGDLTLDSQDLIAKIGREINRNSFFNGPSRALQLATIKALSEILPVEKAYTASESGGLFSRGDAAIAEQLEKNGAFMIGQMKRASDVKVSEQTLPMILGAIALRDSVSDMISSSFKPIEVTLKVKNVVNDVLDDTKKQFDKDLKKFDKNLYSKVYDAASIHRPYSAEDNKRSR
jgi:predicted  nucleic acid-binding Zn-ribbon protein